MESSSFFLIMNHSSTLTLRRRSLQDKSACLTNWMLYLCLVDDFRPLCELYSSNSEFAKIIAACMDDQGAIGLITLHDGFLFRGSQLCILSFLLRLQVIREVYSGGLGDHLGVAKTLRLLRGKYF